jgi:hypothetical protein
MLRYIFGNQNEKKPRRRWFFILLLFSPIIAVALGLLMKTGMEKCPIYVGIGFASFGITFLLVWITALIYGVRSFLYVRRHYYQLWKIIYSNAPLKERNEAGRKLVSFNDPKLVKWGNIVNRFGLRAFLIWFIFYLVIGLAIWILKKMGIEIPLGS